MMVNTSTLNYQHLTNSSFETCLIEMLNERLQSGQLIFIFCLLMSIIFNAFYLLVEKGHFQNCFYFEFCRPS